MDEGGTNVDMGYILDYIIKVIKEPSGMDEEGTTVDRTWGIF